MRRLLALLAHLVLLNALAFGASLFTPSSLVGTPLGVMPVAHAISPVVVRAVADRPVTIQLDSGGKVEGEILSTLDETFVIADTDGDVYEFAYEQVKSVRVRDVPTARAPVAAVAEPAPVEDELLVGEWKVLRQPEQPNMRHVYLASEEEGGQLMLSRNCRTSRDALLVIWKSRLSGAVRVFAAFDGADQQRLRANLLNRKTAQLLDIEPIVAEMQGAETFAVTVRNPMYAMEFVFNVGGFSEALRHACSR